MSSRRLRWRPVFIIPIILAALLIWLLWPSNNAEAAPFWYSTSWSFRRKLVVDHTKVIGGVDLSSFPILVSFSSDEQLAAGAQSSGNDIMFTDSSGTKLDHEIEKYSQGTLAAWVRIPTLSASTDTTIYMYYGNPSTTSQQNATGVWDSSYKGVWHLDEGTGTSRADSTSNANNLGDNGTVPQNDGKVSKAAHFNGTTQYLDIANASQTGLGITGNITIEAWLNSDVTATTQAVTGKFGSSPQSGYLLRYSNGDLLTYVLSNNGTATTNFNSTTVPTSATWYHLVGEYDGTNTYVYVNGALEKTTAYTSGIFNNTERFEIGGRGGTSQLFTGYVDEVRVSNTRRSTGWITTQYNNQNSPSTFFLSMGKEEKSWEPALIWKMDEGYGTSVNDSGMQLNTGSMGTGSSAPTWYSEDLCANGKCLWFDGTNDYVSRTYSSDTELDPGTDSFAVSAWFRHPTVTSGTDVMVARSNNNATTGLGYKIYMKSTGVVCFGIDDDSSWGPDYEACSTDTFNDSRWHNVEGIKNSTTSIAIFIDGKQLSLVSPITNATGSLSGSSPTFYVGSDGDGASNFWQGNIDEVKVYTTVLHTQADAQKNSVKQSSSFRGSTTTFGGANNNFLNDGLLGYWKMDENTGTSTTADSSGNNLTGTMSGIASTAWSAGKFGSALTFDGTNDEVDVASPASDSLWFTSQNFTVSTWIKGATNTAGNTMVRKGNSSKYSYDLSYDTGDNSVNFGRYDGTNVPFASGSTAINDSTWHFITGVKNDSILYVYIDGQLDGTAPDTTIAANMTDPGTNFSIGGRGTNYYKGTEDEVRVYNRAFSPAEIKALYNWSAGPIAYWKLDENTGTTANDNSGSGYSGTLTNNPAWTSGRFGPGVQFTRASSNYITVADNDVFSANTTGQLTVETWMKTSDTTNLKNVLTKGAGSNYEWGFDIAADGTMRANLYQLASGNSYLQVTTAVGYLQANTWYHLAMTTDLSAPNLKFYINGSYIGQSTSPSGSYSNGTATIRMGGRADGNNYFDGILDDIKIYNYARTSSQIIEDMNGGHPIGGSPVGSPVGYWKFDEGSGTTANDNSINANNLTLSTASWTTSGKYNMAWNGTGSSYRLSRTDDSDFDFTSTDNFSIAFWFKSSTASNPGSNQYIVDKEAGTGYAVYADTNGKINFGIDSDGTWTPADTAQSTSDIYDNTWHHIVAIKTGTTKINLYVDGQLQGTDSSISANGDLSNADNLTVGDQDTTNGNEFTGFIDELKIYRAALSQDQVLVEYNRGKVAVFGNTSTASDGTTADTSAAREYCVPGDTSTCNAPVGQWKMDDNTGTTVVDTSGNGNNGSFTAGRMSWIGSCPSGACLTTTNASGNADIVTVTDPASGILDFSNSQDFTAEVWFKSSASENTAYAPLWKGGQSTAVPGYDIEVSSSDNLARCHYVGANSVSESPKGTTNIFNDSKWHHVACVMDRNGTATGTVGYHIFVDGKLEGSDTSLTATTGVNAQNLQIGEGIGNTFEFTGAVDLARIYNYARTPAQVAWDFNRGKPVVWYRLDECSGSSIYNSAKNANADSAGYDATLIVGGSGANTSIGTCSSGTSTEAWNNGKTGQYGASIDFDGTDDYFTTAGVNFLAGVGTTAPTVSWGGWFYPKVSAASKTLIEKTNKFRLTTDSSSRPICDVYVSGAYTSNTAGATNAALSLNSWNHIVCTYNNSSIKYYLNGKLIDSWNQSGSIIEGSTIVYVGQNSSGLQRFRGQVDDVKMYNYPLTLLQIFNDYTFGAVAFK